MIYRLMDTSLLFLNAHNVLEVNLKEDDWVITDALSPEFLGMIRNDMHKVAFVKQQNFFSHGMNVFRKHLFGTNIIAVIGIDEIYEVLQKADECKVSIIDNCITVNGILYKFREFNFIRDTSEIIEYNMETEEICYKPDYYYCNELMSIIVKGYNMTNILLPFEHSSRGDIEGRIWNKGFAFPHQFFDYFSLHTDEYYNNLLKYARVLQKIFSLRYLTKNSLDLENALIKHYSYSIIFSFIVPNISESLRNILNRDELEKIYNLFVLNSPIHNKENLTDNSLRKIDTFLVNVLSGIKNNENYENVYNVHDLPAHNLALMYFVTNMFSDIRRCVINIIIECNPWFASICQHRKEIKIY